MDIGTRLEKLTVIGLNGFKVYRGNFRIPSDRWQRQRITSLFRYLLIACERVPRHQLIDEFWSHLDDSAGRHNLSVTLYNLRRTLWPKYPRGLSSAYITSQASYIGINKENIAFYDVEAFGTFWQKGLAALQQRQWEAAITAFVAAADLYRSDLFIDSIEPWVIGERTRLQNTRLSLLECLARALIETGCYDEAYQYADTLVQLNSLREEGHRMLMQILYARGHRSRAIEQYQLCKSILERELGIRPEPKTNKLYQQIVNGESH